MCATISIPSTIERDVTATSEGSVLSNSKRRTNAPAASPLNPGNSKTPTQFFRVRLWDQNDLIDQLLEHFDKLGEDLRAELPLKRVWTVASPDEEE